MSFCPTPRNLSCFRRKPSERSQALIITLTMVVIATILILSFLSLVRFDRMATASYSQSMKAEQLGLGSLQLVVGQLQQEMSKDAPPDTGNGAYSNSPIYTNVTSANIEPQGVFTNAGMPTLLKISAATNFYTGLAGTLAAFPNGSLEASTSSSTTASLNGRSVGTNRWSEAYMGTYPNTTNAPYWVLMTRNGPANTGTFGPSGATVNNANSTNAGYVVGRFAYAVYNEGALLDITVAGHPSTLNTNSASNAAILAQIKGTLAGADVSAMGIDPDALTKWRNAATSADTNTYVNYVTNFASTNGFQQISPGDSTFLSRQDLIKAAQNNVAGLSTTMLTNLATFTREVNAPSWGPSADASTLGGNNGTGSIYAYKTKALSSTSTNRFIPSVRTPASATITSYLDDGTSTTYSVNAGDPLVQRRFSLARLKWLGPNGPQNGGTAASIQACFGLLWQPSGDSNLATENGTAPSVWTYVGPTGNAEQTGIETLDQVAAETTKREPNFFELLQAGILKGSIGVNFSSGTPPASPTLPIIPSGHQAGASGSTLQILRIGANIINQYGSYTSTTGGTTTFYPAVLEFQQSPGFYWQACGVENLPNVSMVCSVMGDYGNEPVQKTMTVANMPTSVPGAVYLMFGLWNPNQVSADSPNISASPPPVRLHVKGYYAVGSFYGSSVLPLANVAGTTYPGYQLNNPQIDTSIPLIATSAAKASGNGVYGFLNSGVLTSADAVAPARTAVTTPVASASGPNPPAVWAQTYPMGTEGRTDLVGLRLPDFTFSTGTASARPGQQYGVVFYYGNAAGTQPFNAYMEFQTPSGAWVPYQFFTGMNDPSTWINALKQSKSDTVSNPQTKQNPPVTPASYYMNYLAPLSTPTPNYVNGREGSGVSNSLLDATPGIGNTDVWGGWDYPIILFSGDPRSLRFNAWQFDTTTGANSGYYTSPADAVEYAAEHSDLWVPSNGTTTVAPYPGGVYTASTPLLAGGFGGVSPVMSMAPTTSVANSIFASSYFPAQLARNNSNSSSAYLSGNNPISNATWNSYTDLDGILRIGDSGYFTDSTAATGNPFYRATGGRVADQPIILRRPFNSVAELGYVFRDDPWRTLDFFSGKSADAGLLDLFSLHGTSSAFSNGRVDLNSANPLVLQAVFNGLVADPITTKFMSNSSAVVTKLANMTSSTPILNKGDLVTSFVGTTSFPASTFATTDEQMVKSQREATIRALADVGQTRTWNLMIDLVAQTGKYPPSTTGLDQFVVEGERRYWLHIAIDRFTGKIIDQKLEPVTE